MWVQLVQLQVTGCCTLVTALIAVKGLLSTVREQMRLLVMCLCTFVAAYVAAEELHSTVSTNVSL